MAEGFEIDVDAASVLAMLDQLGERSDVLVHEASGETAEAVQFEWRSRVRRATGRYYEAIRRKEAEGPLRGFHVYVDQMSNPDGGMRAKNFPIWQEEGTKYMAATPAMQAAIDLEEGLHLRRVSDALQEGIDEVNGLG